MRGEWILQLDDCSFGRNLRSNVRGSSLQHRLGLPHLCLAARVRSRHIHRAAVLRHLLAALSLRSRHLDAQRKASHRWVTEDDRHQQDADVLMQCFHLITKSTRILPVMKPSRCDRGHERS